MQEFWSRIKSWRPPLVRCSIVAIFVSALSLIFVATDYGNRIPIVVIYAVYVIAAFSLGVEVWAIVCAVKKGSPVKKLSDAAHRSAFTGRLYDDYSFRTLSFAYLSLAVNLLLATTKGVAGWWFSSWWLISLAAYYGLLCIMKFALLRTNRRIRRIKDAGDQRRQEWKAYRLCGILLMCMTILLQGIVVLILKDGQTFIYIGLLIYAVAAYDFFCLTKAIVYMIKNRKKHSPIVVAIKSVSVAASLVAILSLQTAMFASFGGSEVEFQQLMNLLTGTGVCILIFLTGMYMVIHAGRQMKNMTAELCGQREK